jgi:hypothetical protein
MCVAPVWVLSHLFFKKKEDTHCGSVDPGLHLARSRGTHMPLRVCVCALDRMCYLDIFCSLTAHMCLCARALAHV